MKNTLFASFLMLASAGIFAQENMQVKPAKGPVPDNGERYVPQENTGYGLPATEFSSNEKTTTPPEMGPQLNAEPSPTPEQQGFSKEFVTPGGKEYYKKITSTMIIYYVP